ncbi:MAG: PHP domain-containing protein [Clostridia bacterium]|nr:PHP domain-containing protein [Clostridia bacterium]
MSGDLHCHTRLSNGSMGIEELISLAKSRGVETIAVTDHDCLAGTIRAKIIGERNGIKIIPGVELSSVDGDTGEIIHILCYLPEFPDRLEGLCHQNTVARKRASQYMMLKTAQRYPVTAELMKRCASGSTNLYKQHIMHALMECGVADSFYGDVYNELFSPESANNIIVKPAFQNVSDVIDAIHSANGIAVLAHPAMLKDIELINKYVDMGLDGIEVWHPSADEKTSAELFQYAKKKGLLATGGSAFHGLYNKRALTIGDYVTPKTQLQELLGFKAKQKRLMKKLAAEAEEQN